MWPSSWLVTAERDGYFAICPSTRPNPGEDEVVVREQPPQTVAQNFLVMRIVVIHYSRLNPCRAMDKLSHKLNIVISGVP